MTEAFARVHTWWTILQVSLEERLAYRGDFMLATLMRFLPIVTQVLLWTAVFSASGQTQIGGFSQNDVIAYYLLVLVGRAFSSMPGLIGNTVGQIRSGEIKKFIVQPIDLIAFLLLARVAHKLVYYITATLPFALVFWLCRGYFHGWPDAVTLAAFVGSLVLAFLLGFFLELSIGLIAFWWLEVSSLLWVYMLLNFFLSGHMFPLDLLPHPYDQWIRLTPLHYLAYFPAAVFLGKINGAELAQELAVGLAWLLFFILLCRLLLKRGLNHYSGFGG